MLLTLTPAGYSLVQQALTGGSAVVISDFRVATEANYTDFAQLGWPRGTTVYSSRPTDAVALSQDQMCWVCDIDPDVIEYPIGELALYVAGTVFAKGRLPIRIDKQVGQHVRVCATVYGRGIARACTQEYAADSTVDRYLTVNDLPIPDNVRRSNVVVVKGRQAGLSVWAPIVLVKTSLLDAQAMWAVVNGRHVYTGGCQQVAANQISININLFGKNVVLIQDTVTKVSRSVSSISQNGIITLAANANMTNVEIWVGHGFDSDGDCDYSPIFDPPDDPPLDPPPPLCEGNPVVLPPPPPDDPIVVLPPPPPPPPPTEYVGYGVHFCSRPLADPYRENELGQAGSQSLRQRLIQISPYGEYTHSRWFVTSINTNRRMMLSLAFRNDDQFDNPYAAYENGYIAPELVSGVNRVVSSKFSDRVSIGNYGSLLDTLVSSTRPTSGSMNQKLNAIAIPKGYRLVVYEYRDFGGRIIADLRGPYYLMSRQGYNTVRYGNPSFVPIFRRQLTQLIPAALPVELGLPAQSILDPEVSTGVYIEPGSASEPRSQDQYSEPPQEHYCWALEDSCWAGPIGRMIDGKVRRVADQEMSLRTSSTVTGVQAIPYLLEPDLWRWQGSFKVLVDSETT